MKRHLNALLLSFGLATAVSAPAGAYPVDCAILLCLAGGWPASSECTHARIVFIRRITPWPIEPPLQIWNCPMRVGLSGQTKPLERLLEIASHGPAKSKQRDFLGEQPFIADMVDYRADIDISGPAFDFVRSIRVFEIDIQQYRDSEKKCYSWASIVMGSYGRQGQYTRQQVSIAALPTASAFSPPTFCGYFRYRSVFVEWRDHKGQYDFEEVHY